MYCCNFSAVFLRKSGFLDYKALTGCGVAGKSLAAAHD
jgi:hypothetical protein